ncbi:MAG: hypothetical protein JXO22_18150, partial [Phycisphaerae bacterium]|nr:hypothetical protein [Phycisphaerae bacterium]
LGLAGALILLATGMGGGQDITESNTVAAVPATETVDSLAAGRVLLGDANCDGAADVFDIDPFVLAVTQPEQYAAAYPGCDIGNADCNQDGTADIFDIDAFVNIIAGTTPHIAGYSDSGCLRLWECGDDEFSFTVADGVLHSLHANAYYNCCPDGFPVTMSLAGDLLQLIEVEILVEPCWCLCCYDIEATVVGLAPGTYTVEYYWFDYETDMVQCHTESVEIP